MYASYESRNEDAVQLCRQAKKYMQPDGQKYRARVVVAGTSTCAASHVMSLELATPSFPRVGFRVAGGGVGRDDAVRELDGFTASYAMANYETQIVQEQHNSIGGDNQHIGTTSKQ